MSMGNWFLVASLGVVATGALAFLRLVSNEIGVVEKEAAYLRKIEISKQKRPAFEDAVVVEPAA